MSEPVSRSRECEPAPTGGQSSSSAPIRLTTDKRGAIHRRTGRVALSGVVSGLSVAVMLASALLPSMTYALPMIAGALVVIPCIEFGTGAAMSVYAAVSLLSFILPADKEAAFMYVLLFGLYPVLKKYFEQIPSRIVEYIAKFAYFNLAAGGAVFLADRLLGIPFSDTALGRWGIPLLLAAGNVCFLIYDVTLTKYITLYIRRARPVLAKVFHL